MGYQVTTVTSALHALFFRTLLAIFHAKNCSEYLQTLYPSANLPNIDQTHYLDFDLEGP